MNKMTTDKTVWQIEIENFSDDEILATAAMQGIANRKGPKVYLSMVDRHWAMRFKHIGPFSSCGVRHSAETLRKYRSCADVWIDYYGREYGFQFKLLPAIETLLLSICEDVKGIIRFNRSDRAELVLASTMAGIDDAIPVTDAFLKEHPDFLRLPVIADLRGKYPDPLAAQRWAAEKLLPLCSKNAIYSQTCTENEGDDDFFSLDLIVQRKLFSFNLGYWRAKTPDEYELLEKILAKIEPCSPVYGWGTSESAMMIGLAKSGNFLVCTHTPNISFHAAIPVPSKPFKLKKKIVPEELIQRKKYYVSFLVNEGDTLKWMGSLMGFGAWLEPIRGSIPISWGINPWLTSNFPGLMKYYYDSMTENDSFYSLIGYGYYNPKHSSQMEHLTALEAKYGPEADVTAGSIYAVHSMIDATNGHLDERTEDYLVSRKCRGYAFESAQESYLKFTRTGQPVIGTDWELFYWWHRFPAEKDPVIATAEHIKTLARKHEAPYFIPVYGGSPSSFARIAELLPKDEFEIVRLDEMVELAKIYGIEIPPVHTPRQGVAKIESRARTVKIPQVNGWRPDGDLGKWRMTGQKPVEIDLGRSGCGRLKVEYRWVWNKEYLFFLIEEKTSAAKPIESLDWRFYEAGEFDFVDGTAFWFDFDMNGTSERGDFTPWFGFSSRGLGELYCCQLNDKVLTSSSPKALVSTSMKWGVRVIEAAIRWKDIAEYLTEEHLPSGGLVESIHPGFRMGCQPLLIEGNAGRAFLNGRSNKRQNNTAAALESASTSAIPAPTGFDSDSVVLELA
jgi:hypothetical protein